MSVLLLGVSHRSAPVAVLEQVTIAGADRRKLTAALLASSHVSEAMILSTCNRVEVYAVVDAFHGSLTEITELVADRAGLSVGELTKHAYVRYAEAAVEHLFAVTGGLDSMVIGEQQIIGQVRAAYAAADEEKSAGRIIHELVQQALRVGKRVHTETGIDAAGASMVSVALDRASQTFSGSLRGKAATVVGAGGMAGLTLAHLSRAGIAHITVVNRTVERAERLVERAHAAGVSATAMPLDRLVDAIEQADVLVTCTGSVGAVVTLADVHYGLARCDRRPLVICDLGVPRDVERTVAALPDVTVIDIETMQQRPTGAEPDCDAARAIVAEELAAYLAAQRMARVTPTVAALRRRAEEVVQAELLRLNSRLGGLDDTQRDEVARTIRRVVDKLLHAPTVRVKQLAAAPGGHTYAAALRELFELEPGAPACVAAPMELTHNALADALVTGDGNFDDIFDMQPDGEGRAS